MTTPEARARAEIDGLLASAGRHVCNFKDADIHASRGVAVREFPLSEGHVEADHRLYVDEKAASVIDAKKQGATLTGVERQSARYKQGLPASLPVWARPLPFAYESTGVETRFTNGLDPEPRSCNVFIFHQPDSREHQAGPRIPGHVNRGCKICANHFTPTRFHPSLPTASVLSRLFPRWGSSVLVRRTRWSSSLAGGREGENNGLPRFQMPTAKARKQRTV